MDPTTIVFPSYTPVNNKKTLQHNCNVNEAQLLEKLYSAEQIIFTEDFINTLFKIYDAEEFNISNFILFQELVNCNLFMDFLKNETEDKNKQYEKVFNIYFNALAHTRLNVNAIIFKNKICTLLKMTIKLPSYRSGISLKNINVNIATSYKPIDTNQITARCDIISVIKEGFFNSLNASNVETFNFSPHISNVVVQGPLLKNILNSTISMQNQLIQSGRSYGVKLEPFIEDAKKKFEL
ncbi:hypothetical protein HgNV_096 [Homarus gammarus nudivirus]|uniref:Uncharacterized protein n=1 Tax=Homarus gammarus nudivirus TaxID=2509616 RepID=A0A411HBA8_9VIRU|nr:hypothetical protein KM727_gp96 [Homarus gammarus nudivirus]QBB28701.1 hypothetical protein HgNV_096 [Homarus gammarus nudivirus]